MSAAGAGDGGETAGASGVGTAVSGVSVIGFSPAMMLLGVILQHRAQKWAPVLCMDDATALSGTRDKGA
ncbi:hypothetical protein GCM10027396_08800 [Insolitispirillum peregrinum]